MQLEEHLIAAWSRVQPPIALSSGDVVLYAGMFGNSGIRLHEVTTKNWGLNVHRVDASACRATMLRRGCGGLKHITVKSLWVQEASKVLD